MNNVKDGSFSAIDRLLRGTPIGHYFGSLCKRQQSHMLGNLSFFCYHQIDTYHILPHAKFKGELSISVLRIAAALYRNLGFKTDEFFKGQKKALRTNFMRKERSVKSV
jgi:hypothetical protein